jgi:hypothetical protein
MPVHDLSEFYERHCILTYGLFGRKVRITKNGIFWIGKKGKPDKRIEDWSAALETEDHNVVKDALLTMGAQVVDQYAKEA